MWIVTTELYHYGMPRRSGRYPFGSGARPFQAMGGKAGKSKNNDPSRKQVDRIRNANNEIQNIARTSNRMIDRSTRDKKIDYTDKSMSDAELQKKINRLQLEQRYNQLMNQKNNMSRGKEAVKDVIDTAGDIVAIGASAATIYLMIKSAKG